ncbi:MAG: 2Fe-2S iron-sulfur cluster-binding protein [Gammaproteobacteria bacterium]
MEFDFVQWLGSAVLLLIGAYVISLILGFWTGQGRARRQFALEQQLLGTRIEQASSPLGQLAGGHGPAWSGLRKFIVKAKVLEADSICSFYLAPHDGQPLPPFFPGQFLTFQLELPENRGTLTRCYSLSDAPVHPEYYRVTIKRIPPPGDKPELPPGKGSSHFHDDLREGQVINVKAPSGHFYLDVESDKPVVLIGGGIGLTPVLSMLNYLCHQNSEREIWFFYGVRNSSEHVMKEFIAQQAKDHPNVKLKICYSDPLDGDEEGEDFQHAERVSVDLFKRVLPSHNYSFYICGPPPMMASLTEGLGEWGVPEADVHFEAFGPASVKKVAHSEEESKVHEGLEVKFARSGKTLVWDGASASLLEFAESNGLNLDCGCRAGGCGSCATAIQAGSVEYVTEPDADVEKGHCLTCVSIPKTALTLDA